MKISFLISSIVISFSFLGCSALNPGYLSSNPDMKNLKPYKSTLSDVQSTLGDPAISQMAFYDKVTYKYYYKTPDASIDQMQMIKGDYSSGCKECGQVIATFKWGKGMDFKNFLLTGLSVTDNQLRSQTNSALMLIGQNKFLEAYPMLVDAANKYYAPAEQILGLMYAKGDGVQQDYKQAAFWFARGAAAEYPPSLYDLGAIYRNGEGVPVNIDAAKYLYTKSANLGYLLAMQELIKIYQQEGDQKQVDLWEKEYQSRSK